MSIPPGSDPKTPVPGMRPDTTPDLPMALKLVALLTILAGITSLTGSVFRAMGGHVYLSVELLCIPAGIGLLRRREGWRIFMIAMTCAGVVVSLVILLVFLLMSDPPVLRLFGEEMAQLPETVIILSALTLFLGLVWQFRVLVRSDVRFAFGIRDRRGGGGII